MSTTIEDAAEQSDGGVLPSPSVGSPSPGAEDFVADCCATDAAGPGTPHDGRKMAELHAAYAAYAAARGAQPLTRRQLGRRLTALGYPPKSHGVREGLRLKEVMPLDSDRPGAIAETGGAHPHHAPSAYSHPRYAAGCKPVSHPHLVGLDPPKPTPGKMAESVVGRAEVEALAYTPEIDPANPEPPPDLTPAAAEVFRSTVAEFGPEGSTTWDRASLQALSLACRNLDTAHRAAAEIASKGVEMESPRGTVARPSVAIQDKATARYMAIMKTLGVTR